MSASPPKLVTALGILCVLVGVSWGFIDVATNFRYRFFTDYAGAFLVTLVVGILLSAAGTVAWVRQLNKGKRLRVAGCIFVVGLIAFLIVPNNVHGPGMLLAFAAISALILSVVLALMGRAPDKS